MTINLWQPGQSGNPAGRTRGSRNALSEEVVCALLRDFRKHGEKAIARVRNTKPEVYLKVLAMLMPREHKVETVGAISALSDEQLDQAIATIQDMLAARAPGAGVIDVTPRPLAIAAPSPPRRRRSMVRDMDQREASD